MNPSEHVSAVMALGYTEQQARFLMLVARHSGYFLRRQYSAFSGRTNGSASSDFLQNAIKRAHVVSSALDGHVHVFHIRAGALYGVLGHRRNPNRYRHDRSAIRRRLMTLDFILSQPTLTFLATDSELHAFFVDGLQMPAAMIQNASIQSSTHARQLLFGVAPDRARISCVHVDDADRTGFPFERNLRRAEPLCRRLSQPVDMIFATPIDGQQPLAERAFRRVFGDPAQAAAARATRAAEIVAYAQARRRYETNYLHGLVLDLGLNPDEWNLIRTAPERFPGREADMWYQRWSADGEAAVRAALDAEAALEAEQLRLTVHRLPFDYRPLGLWLGGPC